ncbi:RNA helicase [Ranunculus cassubicifolius]
MSTLADQYYKYIDKAFTVETGKSERLKHLLQCLRGNHAQDYLKVIPISGLGQVMDVRQYRAVLCLRLGVPLYCEGSLCPGCQKQGLDKWGDHATQCANDIGFKYRHDLVRDGVGDILHKAGIAMRKEVDLGLMSNDGKSRLKPADLLLYNWVGGKDTCIDITGSSPFVGYSKGGRFNVNGTVDQAVIAKHQKYDKACEERGLEFIPFAFSTYGFLHTEAVDVLDRVVQVLIGHGIESSIAHSIFYRVAFFIQKGVGAQLVARLPFNFL